LNARFLFVVLASGSSLMGCAAVGTREARSSTRVVTSRLVQVPSSSNPVASRRQTGTRVDVIAVSRCDEQREEVLEQSVELESFNQSPTTDYWFLGGGGAVLGLGAYTLADSSRVYPKDTSSRTYNDIGPGTAQLIGISEIVVGASLVAVAAVDAIRASATDERLERTKPDPTTVRTDLACADPVPAVGVRVTLSENGEVVALGETDEHGMLTVQLIDFVPERWVIAPLAAHSATLMAGGKSIGTVNLDAVIQGYAETSWALANTGKCASAESASSCDTVAAYLRDFPHGAHVREAQAALRSAAEAMARLKADQQEKAQREQAEQERQQRLREQQEQMERERAERQQKALEKAEQDKAQRAAMAQAQKVAAQRECRRKCESGCAGNTECANTCIAGACK
jgi:hypothetical protein